MARNTSVEIGDELERFVGQQIEKGRYSSASEVIRAGLRLLQDEETRMAAVRAALAEGENSGPPGPVDVEEFIAARKGRR